MERATVSTETTVEQKLRQALSLINEATRQRIRERGAARDATVCRCSHRHDRHALSCSHNYSAGHCQEAGCKCKWFMMSDGQPAEERML
jgi:hypothetical protein